jgi:tetrahydromethanopterin S-methyltransferase subunit G
MWWRPDIPEAAHRAAAGSYPVAMAEPAGIEQRLSALESRVDEVAADAAAARQDAAAARHLSATHDRDLADLGVKTDAHRRAINALGVQTAARFDGVDQRLDGIDQRFDRLESEMRSGFATAAAGHEQIVVLLNRVLATMDDT